MADINTINTPTRKRKLSTEEKSVIQINNEDETVEISLLSPLVEGEEKLSQPDLLPSQSSDSNLELSCLNSQSSVEAVIINEEPVNDVKQKLLELDDEIRQLKAENDELRSKLSSCEKHSKPKRETVLSITFSDNDNFQFYKDKLIKLLNSSPELCITVEENNLLIDVTKDNEIDPNEWVVIDEVDAKTLPTNVEGISPKKKKRKNGKAELAVTEELFMLDTTPSISTKGHNLCYESKFTVLSTSDTNDKDKVNETKVSNLASCFNCDESHNMRDCPKPRNFMKINAARQKFKSQQSRTVRYHLEDDQRFAHLKPGNVSEKLQRALGLRPTELPPYIYRMRQLGYPPGWFHEIQGAHQSELVMFDFEGKRELKQKNQMEVLHAERIVEYPGFNAPMEKGVKDEYRLYGCPSYSNEVSKQSMLAFIREKNKKAEDNLETCDMDIDNPPSDKEVEIKQPAIPIEKDKSTRVVSPTLTELEKEKQKLLAELTTDSPSSNCPVTPVEELNETNENNESVGEAYCTIDITGNVEDLNETPVQNHETNGECDLNTTSPTISFVKTSSFGTPILKSASPFSRLPKPDNFSQNVSQVINFENLPNSTGKYEQMIGVLDKVRKTLKNLNDQKS